MRDIGSVRPAVKEVGLHALFDSILFGPLRLSAPLSIDRRIGGEGIDGSLFR